MQKKSIHIQVGMLNVKYYFTGLPTKNDTFYDDLKLFNSDILNKLWSLVKNIIFYMCTEMKTLEPITDTISIGVGQISD